jgi:nucleotide-binding universal stress UspA family protein
MLATPLGKIHVNKEGKMFERILVPLDGSELAELGLLYAQELAVAFNSNIDLLHVCETKRVTNRRMHEQYMESMSEKVKQYVTTRQAGGEATAKVKWTILAGDPTTTIIDCAEKNNASLVIIASHGRSGIGPWPMGGTATKILQRSGIPVLFITARTVLTASTKDSLFSRVIVPLDGTEGGESVLPFVKELTSKIAADVTLFYVISSGRKVHTIGGENYIRYTEQQIEREKSGSKEYLEQVIEKIHGARANVKVEVKSGDVSKEVVRFAKETKARLIAMASHGHTALDRWTLGSVAYKVLNFSSTPVLLVKAQIPKT